MAKTKSSERPIPENQISLFGSPETPDAFRKAIQVVHSKPKSPLSLVQRKLGNAWMKHVMEKPSAEDGFWELSIKELAVTIGFDSNNRQYLKESAEALMRIVFEWDVLAPAGKRIPWKASVLFPEIEIHSDVIRYQISAQVRERMINPDMYALIDMNIVRRFRRASSLGIWEFCVRFERIGLTAEVEWEKFRDMMLGESADSKTYQEYKYFKSKVLIPAIAEINSESKHIVELIEAKVGKRVASIQFAIKKKANAEETADDNEMIELISELVKLGVPQSEARKLCNANAPEELKSALHYTKKRMNDKKLPALEKPAAYFRQALAHRYASAEDSPVTKAPSAPRGADKSIDIKEAYLVHQNAEASRYFKELDPSDQAQTIERYNQQQEAAVLRLTNRAKKAAQAAFFRWLGTETWGEPTTEALLEFAQKMLATQRPS
jgi:hypothetical protein